jgi:cytochrome b pre-mRNA-processing protein 3
MPASDVVLDLEFLYDAASDSRKSKPTIPNALLTRTARPPNSRANPYPMKLQLFTSRPAEPTIDALYGAIVAQARSPEFYLAYGVPDTVEGRFDMIVLHLVLLFRRLAREPDTARALTQGVFDRFCLDMDHNLREMGVSDLAVPKQMRGLGEAFYGRAEAYERALSADGGDQPLESVLARNVFAEARVSSPNASRLAAYVLAAVRQLDTAEGAVIVSGNLGFPDPRTVPEAARV